MRSCSRRGPVTASRSREVTLPVTAADRDSTLPGRRAGCQHWFGVMDAAVSRVGLVWQQSPRQWTHARGWQAAVGRQQDRDAGGGSAVWQRGQRARAARRESSCAAAAL
jgi:hypothetical protein